MTALRLIFFSLLLANVIFFAWQQNAGPDDNREPQRLKNQIAPDLLKLVPPATPADAKAADTTATPPAPAVPASAAKTADAKPADAPLLLCKSFAGLSPDAAKAAQSAIAGSAPGAHVTAVPLKSAPTAWWVYIPSQTNKAGAEKKIAELKDMGVNDSAIVGDDGPNRWAVSLGLFSTKEAADAYLKKLNGLGVRSARIDAREKPTDKMRLDITAAADVLGTLARDVKPLATATLGDCPAAKN